MANHQAKQTGRVGIGVDQNLLQRSRILRCVRHSATPFMLIAQDRTDFVHSGGCLPPCTNTAENQPSALHRQGFVNVTHRVLAGGLSQHHCFNSTTLDSRVL